MYVVINLNTYIGGGETLALRFCEFLDQRNEEYVLIVANHPQCWLRQAAASMKLNCVSWPSDCTSALLQNQKERDETVLFFEKLFQNNSELRIFTICMQDFYNVTNVFSRFTIQKNIKIVHGIYHPEDTSYFSSFRISAKKIIKLNQQNMEKIESRNGLIFVNENAIRTTFSDGYQLSSASSREYVPLPIKLRSRIVLDKTIKRESVTRIVMISRFTDFKIGAVLNVMASVRESPEYELSLIGFGTYKFLIKIWLQLFPSDRITFHGKIDPSNLKAYIKDATIGVAQGTAILEIAKFGIPVIVAPYSSLKHVISRRYKFAGIFGETEGGHEFGDYRYSGSCDGKSLRYLVNKVLGNYEYYRTLTSTHIQSFDNTLVGEKILNRLDDSACNPNDFIFPEPGILRKMRYLISKIGA